MHRSPHLRVARGRDGRFVRRPGSALTDELLTIPPRLLYAVASDPGRRTWRADWVRHGGRVVRTLTVALDGGCAAVTIDGRLEYLPMWIRTMGRLWRPVLTCPVCRRGMHSIRITPGPGSVAPCSRCAKRRYRSDNHRVPRRAPVGVQPDTFFPIPRRVGDRSGGAEASP